jgi:hypothetical protein
MAGRQQTAPPQQRRSKDTTAHPHQPGAHPDLPHPDRAHSRRHHPAKAKVKFPLRNRILSRLESDLGGDQAGPSKAKTSNRMAMPKISFLDAKVLCGFLARSCSCLFVHPGVSVHSYIIAEFCGRSQ